MTKNAILPVARFDKKKNMGDDKSFADPSVMSFSFFWHFNPNPSAWILPAYTRCVIITYYSISCEAYLYPNLQAGDCKHMLFVI